MICNASGVEMSIKANRRKRERQKRRHERRPQLAAPINAVTRREEAALQLPAPPISKFSTASLFSELESRGGASGVIAQVISESQRQP